MILIDSHKSLLVFDETIVQKEILVITQLFIFLWRVYQNNFKSHITFFYIKAVMTSSKALGGILKTMVAVFSEQQQLLQILDPPCLATKVFEA